MQAAGGSALSSLPVSIFLFVVKISLFTTPKNVAARGAFQN
jgi:hypothetical protein